MRKLALAFCMTGLVGVGCGGSDSGGGGGSSGPPAMPGTVNEAGMKKGVTTADDLRASLASPDSNGDAISSGAVQLSQAGMTAIGPKAMALTLMEDAAAAVQSAATTATGTKTCNATGCTYDKYGGNGFILSGSVQATDAGAAGKKAVWNLTGTLTDTKSMNGVEFTYIWAGDLTLSETGINGQASGHWGGKGTSMANGQSIAYEYDIGSIMKFNNVVVANKAPTGGSTYAKTWSSVKLNGMAFAQGTSAWEGTKTYP